MVTLGFARRRIRALVMVLGCLVVPVVLTAQSHAAPVAQRPADTVKTRVGSVLTGQLLALDDLLIRTTAGTLSRADVDWIALGATEPPPTFVETSALDQTLLASGERLAGQVATFDGSTLVLEESGIRRALPIDQVLALVFCDTPCSVGTFSQPTPLPQGAGVGLPPTPFTSTGFSASPSPTFQPGLAGGAGTSTAFGPSPIVGTGVPPGVPDTCHGDEQISFSPTEPRVGDELLIAVTSARPYAYPRLTGTESPTVLRNRPGQLGLVYEWTVRPSWPGVHQYVFYVDSTIRCAEQRVEVRRALTTPTPRIYGVSFTDSDDNDNDSNDSDDNDNTAAAATPTLFPTSTPLPVSSGSFSAGVMCSAFATQAQAQTYLRANPTDPLTIDGNHNGIACEGADGAGFASSPIDTTPVTRP